MALHVLEGSSDETARGAGEVLSQYLDDLGRIEREGPAAAFASRGEPAARHALDHCFEWSVPDRHGHEELLERFDPADLWRACASIPLDAPEEVRRVARAQVLRIRREDPWLVFCLNRS